MSEALALVRGLVRLRKIRVSMHGLQELAADGILLDELAEGIDSAILVEDYPEAFKGPSVLVLQRDRKGRPIHVLWAWRSTRLRQPFWSPLTGPTLHDGRRTT